MKRSLGRNRRGGRRCAAGTLMCWLILTGNALSTRQARASGSECAFVAAPIDEALRRGWCRRYLAGTRASPGRFGGHAHGRTGSGGNGSVRSVVHASDSGPGRFDAAGRRIREHLVGPCGSQRACDGCDWPPFSCPGRDRVSLRSPAAAFRSLSRAA
ncbi:hypothetical protein B0J12DRAFT_671626 [Macrophomina phaseolina]|uniref:Uncharacterized protein n=1 Tax=Macrophomina phaseolina TaxID=35725 RepID=A0ABQ8G432_9PEZI|nr:hypothetical protein B0J12DRAFT_671626 [Macrophomina phaseolina]